MTIQYNDIMRKAGKEHINVLTYGNKVVILKDESKKRIKGGTRK